MILGEFVSIPALYEALPAIVHICGRVYGIFQNTMLPHVQKVMKDELVIYNNRETLM